MIHSIVGLMSSGKTLYATYLCMVDYIQNNRNIISNTPLNFKHKYITKEEMDLIAKNNIVYKNASYLLDEFWIWYDSYDTKKTGMIISHFMNQTSKDDLNLYLTAQTNIQNQKRIRENTHRFTECSRVLKINGRYVPINSDKRILPKKLQKILYIRLNQYKRNVFGDLVFIKVEYLKADKIFNLYNTFKKIKESTENNEVMKIGLNKYL